MKMCHIFISGFVQGVGFRQFIQRIAQDLRLTGWVKNLPDNRVEAVFQSCASSDQEAKKQIEKIISICRKGPFLSEVENVEVVWEEKSSEDAAYETFEIA